MLELPHPDTKVTATDKSLPKGQSSSKAKLGELIPEVRPAVESALSFVAENAIPQVYRQQYECLSEEVKKRCDWETVCARLLANSSESLKKVQALQGGGELAGIDSRGRAFFKDMGTEPVMFGFNKDNNLMQIPVSDTKAMDEVVKWADYSEIRKQIHAEGYELFADDGSFGLGDEMKQVETHTKKPFVSSKDRKLSRTTYLECGDKPSNVRLATFDSIIGQVRVRTTMQQGGNEFCGAIRLFRV